MVKTKGIRVRKNTGSMKGKGVKTRVKKVKSPAGLPPGVAQLLDPCNSPAISTTGYSGFGTLRQRNILSAGVGAGQNNVALLYHPCIGAIWCASVGGTLTTFNSFNFNSMGQHAASTSPGACVKVLTNTSYLNTSGNIYSTIVDGDWVYQNLASTLGGAASTPNYSIPALGNMCAFSTKLTYDNPPEFNWVPGPKDEIPIDAGFNGTLFQVQQIIDGWAGRNFLLIVCTGLSTVGTTPPGVNFEMVSLNTYVENLQVAEGSSPALAAGIVTTVSRSKPYLLKAAEWLASRDSTWWINAATKVSKYASALMPAMSALVL